MKSGQTGRRSGESIVEVSVSILVFLLLLAALQGAIRFSDSALKKSRQIRRDTVRICEGLQKAASVEVSRETYDFYATSADGTIVGNHVFSIPVAKQEKKAAYTGEDGEAAEVTFYLFGKDGGTEP